MRKTNHFKKLRRIGYGWLVAGLISTVQAANDTRQIKDILGVTHVSGKYCFTTNDFLNEGADEIAALGTSVIKLWLNRYPGNNYPWNSNWDQYVYSNMVDLVKTPYYQNVINREQFRTILFETTEFRTGSGGYAGISWQDGVSSNESLNCKQDLYSLTKYLLTNYAGTGKTFILQNWEGDNALNFDTVTNETDRTTRIRGMIDWLNARQDGITQARNEVGMTNGVQVFGAAEVNQIPVYKTFGYPLAVDAVLPYLHMDLYSYSDWSTKSVGTEYQLPALLDYLKGKAPPSDYFGEENIFLGEFGCYEMTCLGSTIDSHTTESDRVHREIVGKQLELALKWGVRYIVYWEVYCNGLREGHTNIPAAESDLVGVWLRRPDGSYTGAYKYFQNIMSQPFADYQNIYETENQTGTVSSGAAESEFTSSQLSGNYGSKLTASGTNAFIQYTLYIPSRGTYSIAVRYKASPDRGIFQTSADGTNIGTAIDCYSGDSYVTADIGHISITNSGNKNFRFTVTGKNAASSGYNLALDYISLTPVEDGDSDGLPDWWENLYFGGMSQAATNMSANGINTLYEAYIAGLNPADPQARFGIAAGNSGTRTLQWNAATGRVYSVYWSSNLLNGFILLNSNVTQNVFTDTVHRAEPSGFYRIGVRLN